MKHSKGLSILFVSLFTIGSFASTIPFMLKNTTPQDEIIDGENGENSESELTKEQQKVKDVKDNLFANLSKSNLNFNNLTLDVNHLGSENNQLLLTFNGAVDYMAFMNSYETNDPSDDVNAKFNGSINLKYLDNSIDALYPIKLDENLDIKSKGTGYLYLTFLNTNYKVSGKFINDVVKFLPTVIPDLSNLEDTLNEISKIDIISMLPMIMNVLGSFSLDSDLNQDITDNEYTFNLVITKDLLESFNINFNQDIKLSLTCDSEGLLTHISLEELNLNGISISLDGSTNMNLDEENGYTSDFNEDNYTNDLDCTTNLLTTIGSLINEKKFSSNYNLSINEYQNDSMTNNYNLNGTLQGDISKESSFTKGAVYDFTIDQSSSFNNSIKLKYQDETTYLNLNDDIKGKVENSTIEDIFSILSKETDNQNIKESTDLINSILSSMPLYEIINGNWSKYKEYIKSLTINDKIMDLKINASLFNLPNKDFDILIDLNNDKLNSLSIKDLPITQNIKSDGNTYLTTINFDLSLKDYQDLLINKDEYASMKVATPLFKTLKELIDSKTLALDYNIDISNSNNTKTILNGDIFADFNDLTKLSSSDFNDPSLILKDKNLGNYSLSLNTTINSITHNAKLNFQNNGLYLDYFGIDENHARSRLYFTNQSLGNIFDFVNGLNGSSSSTETFEPINDVINSLNDFTLGDIFNILKADTIKNVTQYIDIYNENNKDSLVVNIDTKLFDLDGGNLTLILNDNTNELLTLSASINLNDGSLYKIDLNFKNYDESYLIPEQEITDYYKNMDGTVDSILNLINGFNSSMKLNAYSLPLNNDQEREQSLSGYVNIDTNFFEGFFESSTTSSSPYKIEFQKDTENHILFEYNDLLQAQSNTQAITDSIKEISTIKEDNILYIYLEKILPLINLLTSNDKNSFKIDISDVINLLSKLDGSLTFEVIDSYVLNLNLDINKILSKINNTPYEESKIISLSLNFNPLIENTYLSLMITYDNVQYEIDLINGLVSDNNISFSTDIGIIDLNDLPILIKMGISTTNKNAYKISGTLNTRTSGLTEIILSVNINANVDVYISVSDSINDSNLLEVKCLINLSAYVNENKPAFGTKATREYVKTSFYVYQMNAYIKRTLQNQEATRRNIFSSWSDYSSVGDPSVQYQKVQSSDMVKNIVYYLFAYSLRQDSLYNQINNMFSGADMDINTLLGYINSFKNVSAENKFQLVLDIMGILDLYVDIGYNSQSFELENLHVYTTFDIFIATLSIDLNVSNQHISGIEDIQNEINEFDNFILNFSSNDNTKNLNWVTDPTTQLSDPSFAYTTNSNIF